MDARSTHRTLNTLTCLVVGLIGQESLIELHNDSYVTGTLVNADAKMNVEMRDACLTDGNGRSLRLSNLHVMGRRIRYVHIPDHVDVMKMLENEVEGSGQRGRGRARGRGGLGQRGTVRSKIAYKKEQQTLRRFQSQRK